jgi:glycoside/pentoside/hexuronide:cation symporter, GPH family
MAEQDATAPRTPPWRYAVGMFGTSIPINLIRGSILLFFVEILGMDVRAYGTVMVVYAIVDAIDNPVLGHLSDRTRSRSGRRRPWLLVGAPLLAASLVALFWVPEGVEGAALVAWFAVFAILCEAFDSLLNANYGALLPELFPDERAGRARANALRQGFQLVALILSLAITPLLTTSLLGTQDSVDGFRATSLLYAVISLVALLLMALGIRENPRYATAARPAFWRGAKAVVTNRWFWAVGLVSACYGISMALVLAGVQLYVLHTLRLPVGSTFVLMAVVIVVAAGGLVLWTRVVARRGALTTWRLAFAVLALSFAGLFLARDLGTAAAAGVVLGIGWSGMLATNDLVVARVLDGDADRHGEHREGLFLSAFGFFGRLNGAVTGLALISLGLWFGYDSGDDPGEDPGTAFRVYVSVYPFVLATIGAVASRFVRVPEVTPAAAVPGATGDAAHR